MAAAEESRLDIVIYGASGFAGKCAVEIIIGLAKEKGNLTWGVAGRSEAKLKAVLAEVSNKTGENLNTIPIIVADTSDNDSLTKMAKRARVVANCVGPYKLYGEAVVKACLAGGAHHVDISGEPEYMEKMQLDHHKAAEEKGVYIISACGFDSIPNDMGTTFLVNNFEGDLNSVESYMQMSVEGELKGAVLNYGTFASVVHGAGNMSEIQELHRKLFPTKLPDFTPKLKSRGLLHKCEYAPGWCVPFLGADEAVIERSQRYLYERDNKRPAQFHVYMVMKSFLTVLALAFFGGIIVLLSKFKCGRTFLLKHPKFFSFGYASQEGPSEETMRNTKFTVTLVGKGWREKLAHSTDNRADPPNRTVIAEVSGRDPGYSFTCHCLLLSAITILTESHKMPSTGGVLTPGAAFAKTSFVEELRNHGVKFEVISTKDK